jgi:hypothetical protein
LTELQAFFEVGFKHIIDVAGIDHILFVVALCALYDYTQIRRLLVLITAFTLGHSLTLALASMNVINFNPKVVEMIIPITIFLTAFYNFFEKENHNSFAWGRYLMAFFFGTIHGLAFSNFLRVAFQGTNESIILKLLAFNVGLEAGQILVIIFLLGIKFLYDVMIKHPQRNFFWQYTLSGVVLLWSLKLFYGQIYG